jgi:hypothetical protein
MGTDDGSREELIHEKCHSPEKIFPENFSDYG